VDRYGPLILVQSFREPLASDVLEDIRSFYADRVPAEVLRFDRRAGEGKSEPVVAHELGLKYWIRQRHKGRDPHLFLDFRVARRWLRAHSEGKSVLNLFAYTGGAGLAAAAGGASEVLQVDFSPGNLEIAQANASLNGLSVQHLTEDVIPVLWQLTGQGVKGKAARRRYTRLEERPYDLVVLDPPAYSKGPFGAVDLRRDYPTLLKPALAVLTPGGTLLATCNVGEISVEDFLWQLQRTAAKAGLPVEVEQLVPEEDFPSPDDQPPLKILLARRLG
jgi:23S rRNA (cytosine1962-C5)-methyltransferase